MLFNGLLIRKLEIYWFFWVLVNGLNEEIKKFDSIHEEIEFFTNKYKINGDLSVIFEKNAEVAEMNSEMNVANIWRNTFFILEESKKLKEKKISSKQLKFF